MRPWLEIGERVAPACKNHRHTGHWQIASQLFALRVGRDRLLGRDKSSCQRWISARNSDLLGTTSSMIAAIALRQSGSGAL